MCDCCSEQEVKEDPYFDNVPDRHAEIIERLDRIINLLGDHKNKLPEITQRWLDKK